jgi:hypothetical protein
VLRDRRLLLLVASLAVAYGVLLQPPGCNQTAHYGLAHALAHGTPRIDATHGETCDTAFIDGHYFAAKAPGLALFVTPWFEGLRALGLVPRNPGAGAPFPQAMLSLPRRALWQVSLFGAALPALALVLLVAAVAREIEPRASVAAAGLVGLGTLVLPFSTVLFAHVLGACLAFAAFATLFLRGSPLLAGLLAGLAVCIDFPLAVVAVALAVYVWRRAAPFVAGVVAGVIPLLAFDTWAFGKPFHLSYANAVLVPGASGHDVLGANSSGFFGVGVPSVRVGGELLFSPRGLFVLSPVLLAALLGLWRLRARGFGREAALAASLFAVFLVYNAGYYVPFGGYVPGPRFLLAIIPFLALGLPAAIVDWPLATAALGLFSIGAMTVATAAEPLLGNDDTHNWVERWHHGDFAQSVMTLAGGGHGWWAVAPFLLAVGVGVAVIAASFPLPRVTLLALAGIACAAVLFAAAPDLLHTDRAVGQSTGLLTLVVLLAASVVAVSRTPLAAAPLLLLLVPGLASHTKQSLVVVVASLVVAGAVELLRRQRRA